MRNTSGFIFAALIAGCASAGAHSAQQAGPIAAPSTPSSSGAGRAAAETTSLNRAQYPSTYRRHPNPPVLIRNATIMTATGQEIPNG